VAEAVRNDRETRHTGAICPGKTDTAQGHRTQSIVDPEQSHSGLGAHRVADNVDGVDGELVNDGRDVIRMDITAVARRVIRPSRPAMAAGVDPDDSRSRVDESPVKRWCFDGTDAAIGARAVANLERR
jgi:hypothetical protein